MRSLESFNTHTCTQIHTHLQIHCTYDPQIPTHIYTHTHMYTTRHTCTHAHTHTFKHADTHSLRFCVSLFVDDISITSWLVSLQLVLVNKTDVSWWSMSNSAGEVGLVPVTYIDKLEETDSSKDHVQENGGNEVCVCG